MKVSACQGMIEIHLHKGITNLNNHTVHPVPLRVHHGDRVANITYLASQNTFILKYIPRKADNHFLTYLTISVSSSKAEIKCSSFFQSNQLFFKCRQQTTRAKDKRKRG